MSTRRPLAVTTTLLLALVATSSPALAGWGPEPVQVHGTGAVCSQVAACGDDANGAIVVWEETVSQYGGVLKAHHLLATGDPDPAWTTPVTLSAKHVFRKTVQAVTDGVGGVFVSWMQGDSLFLHHLTASGAPATGWPANGKALARTLAALQRPVVISDGHRGVYVCWTGAQSSPVPPYPGTLAFHLERIGGNGLPPAGWSKYGRSIGVPTDFVEWVVNCTIALAPSGELWAAWASTSFVPQEDGTLVSAPGGVRLLRLGPNGLPASGWDPRGVELARFPVDDMSTIAPENAYLTSSSLLVAVCSDGGEGAYVVRGVISPYSSYSYLFFAPALHHLDGLGGAWPGWPAGGIDPSYIGGPISPNSGHDASFRVLAGGDGDVFVGYPATFSDGPPASWYTVRTPAGRVFPVAMVERPGHESSIAGEGVLVVASFYPHGPTSAWDDYAHISCRLSTGPGFGESHTEPVQPWYGDVGAAALPDGGAIFCWSQHYGRFGVFAVRLNRAGLVTDVPPAGAASAPRLALRFAPGAGLRASAMFAGAGEARLLVADVAGRAVARETFEAGEGAREWTIPGTASLAPGLYFARVQRGAEVLTARVVVTR